MFDDNFDRPALTYLDFGAILNKAPRDDYYSFKTTDFDKGYVIEFVDDGVGLSVFISTRGGSRYHLFNYTSHEFSFLKNKHILFPKISNSVNLGNNWFQSNYLSNENKDFNSIGEFFIPAQKTYFQLQSYPDGSKLLVKPPTTHDFVNKGAVHSDEQNSYSTIQILPFDSHYGSSSLEILTQWFPTMELPYMIKPEYGFVFTSFYYDLKQSHSSEFANKISQIKDKDNAEFIIIGVNDPSLTSLN